MAFATLFFYIYISCEGYEVLIHIFVPRMNRPFKYLYFLLLMMIFSVSFLQGDSSLGVGRSSSYSAVKLLCDECSQYQHTSYEPEQDICIAGASLYSNSNVRLQSSNKRSGSGGRVHSCIDRMNKCFISGAKFIHLFNKNFHKSILAQPQVELIRLCKLII